MGERIVRVAAAIAVIVGSLPLSLLAMERGFGLGAMPIGDDQVSVSHLGTMAVPLLVNRDACWLW